MSSLKANAHNIQSIVVTPEVSHAPMSSLKDDFPSNKYDMSVTPPVSHVEMWPYVASAAVASESHEATAVRILESSIKLRCVGAPVDQQVLAHMRLHDRTRIRRRTRCGKAVVSPGSQVSTSSSMHQPRSWSKAEASRNILSMRVTPEMSHAPMLSEGRHKGIASTVPTTRAETRHVRHPRHTSRRSNVTIGHDVAESTRRCNCPSDFPATMDARGETSQSLGGLHITLLNLFARTCAASVDAQLLARSSASASATHQPRSWSKAMA